MRKITIVSSLISIVWLSVVVSAQSEKFVFCQQNQGWLINNRKVAKLGQCSGNLGVKINIGKSLSLDKANPLKKKVLKMF